MWNYTAPLRDMRFVIETILGAPASWREIPRFSQLDGQTAAAVLKEAARFSSDVLAPTNAVGDKEGCTLGPDGVRTPAGYRETYRAFMSYGWPALCCSPDYGGQGLPQLLNVAVYEMLVSVNHAWAMYPGLLHGAYECIKAHGSPAIRERYLSKLVSGEWLAAMALTEPQAGSDLGLIRTQAERDIDGSVRVTGNKIFISGGDHDLTDNIVHLVLCRLTDAPGGTQGLSLVLVPKFLPDGSRNALQCQSLEHKMGIKGSATCAMRYEGATGWLIGEPNRGLAAMFVMMNSARLHVGLQGLSHLEMATQNAVRYARERLQMRAPIRASTNAADPIIEHPGVRRTLSALIATTEAARVVAYWTAQMLDEAEQHPDAARRERANELSALLTPIVKGFLTDLGHHGANSALQIWGGYGYVHDFGIEQTVRDSRISMLYEGTNEIQAIDLLVRKVLSDGGKRLELLLTTFEKEIAAGLSSGDMLAKQISAARAATNALLEGHRSDPEWPYRVADDYLRAMGYLLLTWGWLRIVKATASHPDSEWHANKLTFARFGLDWLTPQTQELWWRVRTREMPVPDLGAFEK